MASYFSARIYVRIKQEGIQRRRKFPELQAIEKGNVKPRDVFSVSLGPFLLLAKVLASLFPSFSRSPKQALRRAKGFAEHQRVS